jgi:hypothetical protein
MLALGESLQARYVVAGTMTIRSRRTWHILGPRAKAKVLVDTRIVDTERKAVVFNPKDAGKTARHKQGAQTAVGIIVSLPIALFMGGSRGKMERRALPKTLRAVYADFFDSLEKPVQPIALETVPEHEGLPPRPSKDVVLLTDGDKLTGTIVSPDALTITTSYGAITPKLREVAKITVAVADEGPDVLILANGDQLSGELNLSRISLALETGDTIHLSRDQIKIIEIAAPTDTNPGT